MRGFGLSTLAALLLVPDAAVASCQVAEHGVYRGTSYGGTALATITFVRAPDRSWQIAATHTSLKPGYARP